MGDAQYVAQGSPMESLHAAGAFDDDVDPQVGPEASEGVCDKWDEEGEGGSFPAEAGGSSRGARPGEVLAGWASDQEEHGSELKWIDDVLKESWVGEEMLHVGGEVDVWRRARQVGAGPPPGGYDVVQGGVNLDEPAVGEGACGSYVG